MLQRLKLPLELDGSVWRYTGQAAANRPHNHAELEVNLVARGRGTYLIGNRRYQIHRSDMIWLFPEQEHVLFEQSTDFEMWIGVFRRKTVLRCAVDPEAQPLMHRSFSGDMCRRLKHADCARAEQLFAELSREKSPGLLNAGLGYALLYAWRCFQGADEVAVHDLHPAVERTAQLLRRGHTDLTLTELAARCGLSPCRLSRLFKEQTGSALVDFRNRQRLERFQHLYASRSITLLDAALAAGFGSYPQFHRVFRKLVGCSPQEYVHTR